MSPIYFKKIFFILTISLEISFSATLRIMPVGDSITYDDSHEDFINPRPAAIRTAYRNHLYYLLQDKKLDFQFVGSRIAGSDIIPPFDPYNEGYPGRDSFYIANNIYRFLVQNPANIVLLHIGTNDHRKGNMRGMQKIFDEIDRFEKDYNYPIRIILALIIQRQYRNDTTITTFNNNLAVLSHDLIEQGDNIIVIDMENDAKLRPEDFRDNTHPNDIGYTKMAHLWVNPILEKRNDKLYLFPLKLVKRKYISKVSISEISQSITFQTLIPDNGIEF